ncbi:MAG: hypothetical protein ABI778_01460 [Ignavibacteriota bacterium]
MTTILGLLLSISVLSSPNMRSNLASGKVIGQIERIATAEHTFSAQNLTSVSIGDVTIHEANQTTAHLSVGGSGSYSTTILSSAVGCEVNGQPLTQGESVRIIVNETTSVRATWTSDIIVFDQDEKM